MTKVFSNKAPSAIGPYSQAMKSNGFVFTSGQLPNSLDADIKVQVREVLDNVGYVLTAAGCGFENVIKTTCFLADIADFAVFNEIYAEVFGEHKPARSCFQVAALPKGAKVEMEVIAEVE